MTPEEFYTIEYHLALEDGRTISYALEIDKNTLVSRCITPEEQLPQWTRMHQDSCSQCSLANTEYCPIATRLVAPVLLFNDILSHTRATTTVITPERNYVKKSDAQDALRSLFGLIMATSGCPLMQPFKFMARYHLPFSTLEETISRITTTHLMRQMITHPDAKEVVVNLKEIETLYNSIQALNEGIIKRLRKAAQTDSVLNAVVILSAISSLVPIIFKSELEKLKPLFK